MLDQFFLDCSHLFFCWIALFVEALAGELAEGGGIGGLNQLLGDLAQTSAGQLGKVGFILGGELAFQAIEANGHGREQLIGGDPLRNVLEQRLQRNVGLAVERARLSPSAILIGQSDAVDDHEVVLDHAFLAGAGRNRPELVPVHLPNTATLHLLPVGPALDHT